jgi:TPR repeat protein
VNIFREEASLTSALNNRLAAENKLTVQTTNLEIASQPSGLTGQVNQDSVRRGQRLVAETQTAITSADSTANDRRAKLRELLNSALDELPAPEGPALEPVWRKVAGRNKLPISKPRLFAGELEDVTKAAANGDAAAQYNLGVMYATGRGVPKDAAKAFEWWQKAAAKGHAVAQYNLGVMYATGEGIPKDTAKASGWWQKAAAQGNADAQTNLGVMYENGRDVPKDEAKAFEWYQKAAAQGVAQAQYNVGVMYAKGQGVPKDDVQAYAWCELATAQGHTNAATLRDLLEAELTPDQLAAAEKLSSELLAKMPKR